MNGLPGAFFFACVGFFVCLAWVVLMAVLIIGWAFRARHRVVDAAWWVRARLAVRDRPAWIPAAPKPLTPWVPRPKVRLTNEEIIARLRRLDSELEAEYGGGYVQVLDRFYGNDHTDH